MNHKIDWDLIIKLLEDNLNSEEEKKLKGWAAASSNHKLFLNHLHQIWETADNPLPQPDLEFSWQKFKNSIEIPVRKKQECLNGQLKKYPIFNSGQFLKSSIFQAAAASFLGIISIYFLLQTGLFEKMHEIRVENMQQKNIILSDSSRLILDAGSIFKYPETFNEGKREVYLSGEGYFEVNPEPTQPFIIYTDDAVITVLGTKFNLRAWQKEKEVTLAVVEGTVEFKAKEKKQPGAAVLVMAKQVSVLKNGTNPTPPVNTDIIPYLTWRQRKIYFRSIPLQRVLDQLERWYNVEIQLPDNTSSANLVTVFIDDKPLENILDIIALMNGYSYHRDGTKVIFSYKQ